MVLASVGPAQARPVYMKLGDIKGESATARDHKEWIEILSMRLKPETPTPTASSGGVQVATGDVDGDGLDDQARARHGSDASAGKGARADGVGGGAMPSVTGRDRRAGAGSRRAAPARDPEDPRGEGAPLADHLPARPTPAPGRGAQQRRRQDRADPRRHPDGVRGG